MTITDKIPPIHPGEVLMEGFINGFGITQNRLAVSIGVPPRRINEIELWINLQSRYELDRAEDLAGEHIASITPLRVA